MRYIKDIDQVNSKCDRIIGLQKLKEAGLDIPSPIKIVLPRAFKDYKKNKKFSKLFIKEVTEAFYSIRKINPNRGVYAGRAFYVPEIKQPPGPRSSSVREVGIILKEVKKLFDFAIKNKFDKKGSEIGSIFYPFISPKLPFSGGCITPSTIEKNIIVIEAIYGVDEGIQTLPHDVYHVDVTKNKIVEKKIAEKLSCLEASSQLKYSKRKVPKKLQLSQVISDELILIIARYFTKFILQFGSHRLEFAVQSEGVYFRECVPFALTKIQDKKINIKGSVIKVSSIKDLKNIGENNKIVFIDPKIIQTRNFDLITSLAFNFSEQKIILYPGSVTTAHAATVLRETGHTVVFVANQSFKTKDKVEIKLQETCLKAEKIN